MTFGAFLSLKENAVYSLRYSCGNEEFHQAFIREVSYEPNREGGIASFKLIRANSSRNEAAQDI
jgi:hypothetical protein